MIEVEIKLERAIAELPPAVTEAEVLRPERGDELSAETGASTHFVDGVVGAVAPHQAGDVVSHLRLLPGVQVSGAGASVLGLGESQMKTSLNGVAFNGTAIPRDARAHMRLYTSTYDPARGGFSAAEAALHLIPGGEYADTRSHVALSFVPALHSSATRTSNPTGRAKQISVGSDGELKANSLYYNAAIQAVFERTAAPSIMGATPQELEAAQISPDSVAEFLQALRSLGLQENVPNPRRNREVSDGSAIFRLDYKPFENAWAYDTKSSWSVIGYGRFRDHIGIGLTPTVTPGFGGTERSTDIMLAAEHARYWGKDFFTQTRSAISRSDKRTRPYSSLPSGRVLVSADDNDASLAAAWLQFGGNAMLGSAARRSALEVSSETQFYVSDRRAPHRIKLYAQTQVQEYVQGEAPGYALYSFYSIRDLSAGVPALFTRRSDSPRSSVRAWSGAFAVGDLWRKSRTLSLLYGVRAEGYSIYPVPTLDSRLKTLFDHRNDHRIAAITLSPRFGFTWIYSRHQDKQDRYSVSDLATVYSGPAGALRGGIGLFRNLHDPAVMVASVRHATHEGTPLELMCVGSATPRPDWMTYARTPTSLPTTCVTNSEGFSSSAPSAALTSRLMSPPRSWRANLGWTTSFRAVDVGIEGVYSLNLAQPGIVDLNFSGVSKSTLPFEAGRPIFVESDEIVRETGATSPTAARLTRAYSSVLKQHSDHSSVSRQFTLSLMPHLPAGRYMFRAAYTLLGVREKSSGFDATTRGDPREIETARASVSRHQFQVQAGVASHGFLATTQVSIASGVRFTPIVAGDVNGDGLPYNDRAFVFDPSSSALRNGNVLRGLLSDSQGRISRCLAEARGRIAPRNACAGPWTATVNANIIFPRGLVNRWLRTGERVSVSVNIENVLGGLDRALYGSRARGWGAAPVIDPVLYRVRGFDAAERSFLYEVNGNFGGPDLATSRVNRPYRVTLDVAVGLGPPRAEQQLNRALRPGRTFPGVRLGVDSLKKRYARSVPDIYAALLAESDSLLLTEAQVDSLVSAQARYRAKMDSLWQDLAVYLANLDHSYDPKTALARQEATLDNGWEIARVAAQDLSRILSPVQLRLMPWPANWLYAATRPIKGVRFY